MVAQSTASSLRLKSYVQHSTSAGVAGAAAVAGVAACHGREQRDSMAGCFATMSVVVARSHVEWRQTSSPSRVTQASHSIKPAPLRTPTW